MRRPRRVAAAARAFALGSVLALAAGSAAAWPADPAGEVWLTQRVGAALPLDSAWVEADGRRVALGDLFGDGRPVLFVVGYYSCPQLCGLLMHGVLEAVHAAGPGARGARIVGVSIDPDDTPATARARLGADLAYAAFVRGAADERLPELHLLTGGAAAIASVGAAAGYRVRPGEAGAAARYEHPAALVVATPDGRISRYLTGVRFDAAELAAALAAAQAGRTGTVTDRIALLCAHVDLALGRRSAAVLQATRAILVVLALALARWCWRRRLQPREAGR